MVSIDRRLTHRRDAAFSTTVALGASLTKDRREREDRRRTPRRRSDMRTISHFADAIEAGRSGLEVIVDGSEGLRLVAMFACGCVAIEPVGEGVSSVEIEACKMHASPGIKNDRRRRR